METKRLVLRQIDQSDWTFFKALHMSKEVMNYVSDPLTEAEILAKFEARLSKWNKTNNCWLALTIIDKATGSRVGVTGFYSQWQPYQQAELGFLISAEFQGKGYGKESTLAVLKYTFNQCNFHKVIATVTEGNQASVNLLKALGFIHEGTLRDNFKLNGQWCNDLKLGLLRSEFKA